MPSYTIYPHGNQIDHDLIVEGGRGFWADLWDNVSYDNYFRKLERGLIHPDDYQFEICGTCRVEQRLCPAMQEEPDRRRPPCYDGEKLITDRAFARFAELQEAKS